MKSRLTFVSNSSSSSFILKNELDIKKFKKYCANRSIIKVTDIISELSKVIQATTKFKQYIKQLDANSLFYDYEDEDIYDDLYQRLVSVNRDYPGAYITDFYSRDYAYDANFDFEIFEED